MRRVVTASFVFLLSILFGEAAAPSHSYVGVKACAPCHRTEKQGKQQPIWAASKHAKAFATLKTPEAQKVAEKAGVKGPAHEAAQCLKCHATVPAAGAAKPTFAKEDGVQCETCHGPGSDYKTMAIMKDRAKAVAAGMIPISLADGSAEKQCKECHNEQSPTFKGFNFKEEWPKIAHPVPKS
ncbi:MAG TPA: cytochrome c family protein [Acidobacteriota bacterium]|jgi:excinuclease UvrABC ATPase subunit|nr:cytochrome c family protein [Acidobacteriota bacterium]